MDERTLLRLLASGPPNERAYRPGLDASSPGARPMSESSARPQRPARAATAALILWLALLALAVLAMQALPSSRPAVPETRRFGPYLRTDIPAVIDSGTVQTVLGPLHWAHVLDDHGPIPMGPVVPGVTGLLSVDATGLWVSADGLRWDLRPLPTAAASATLTLAGGEYWLSTTGPTSLWRSDDAMQWTGVDLSALESPKPEGLDWELILGIPVSKGGVTIFPVTHRVTDPGLLLGREPTRRSEGPRELEPGRYEVVQITPRGGLVMGDPIRIEEMSTGLRVTAEDGTLINVIDGVDLDFIRAWGTRNAIEREQIGVVAGASIVPVELPGMPYPDLAAVQAPVVLDAPVGFRALATDPNGRLHAWRSSDGRTWESSTATDRSISELRTEPGYGHPTRVWDMAWPERTATSDGVTWGTGPGLQLGAGQLRYDSGFDEDVPPQLLVVGSNGSAVPVAIRGLSKGAPRDRPYDTRQRSVGNTAFVTNTGPVGPELWVLELTPGSA